MKRALMATIAVVLAGAHCGIAAEGDAARVQKFVLRLPKAAPADDIVLHLVWTGGPCRQAWAVRSGAPEIGVPAYASDLKMDGAAISGKCKVVAHDAAGVQSRPALVPPLYHGQGPLLEIMLDARIEGSSLTGSFSCAFQKQIGKDKYEPAETKGAVTGSVETWPDARNALAPGKDFPCWRGASGGGAVAQERGEPLVDSWKYARLVWKSEEEIPPGYYEGMWPSPLIWQCGFTSPAVAEGKLVVTYFIGNRAGGFSAGHDTEGSKDGLPVEVLEQRFANQCDDIVVCMDATTGRTLWRYVFEEKGPNITGSGRVNLRIHSKAGNQNSPCIGEGKAFVGGMNGMLAAFDLETGKVLWKVKALEVKQDAPCQSALYTDGVVVWLGKGLTGYDAATGKVLWSGQPVSVGRNRPGGAICWRHKGRTYIITQGGVCIEPKSGKVLWKLNVRDKRMMASEDYLVVLGTPDPKGPAPTLGFRVTPTEATKLWELPGNYTDKFMETATLYANRVYVHHCPNDKTVDLVCLDAATGKELGRLAKTQIASTGSMIAGDGIVIGSAEPTMMLLKADPQQMKGAEPTGGWRVKRRLPPLANSTTPALADGRLFFRSQDGVYCYDLRRPSDEELVRMEQAWQAKEQEWIADYRAGKTRLAQVVQNLAEDSRGAAAETLLAEAMANAMDRGDAGKVKVIMEAAVHLGREPRPLLWPLMNRALSSGNANLALAVMMAPGAAMAGGEAEKTKAVLLRFLDGNDPSLWEPAAAMLCAMDDSARNRVLQAMSRFDKGGDAAAVLAAVRVIRSVAEPSQDEAVRKSAASRLTPLLRLRDVSCQKAAIAALGALGPDARSAVPELEDVAISLPDLAGVIEVELNKINPARTKPPSVPDIAPPDL